MDQATDQSCRVLFFCVLTLLVCRAHSVMADETRATKSGSTNGSAPEAKSQQSVTTADPELPVDRLRLMLKPLTKAELEVEVTEWVTLLQNQVQRISDAEVSIKFKNVAIEKSEELTDAVDQAKAAVVESDAKEAPGAIQVATEAAQEAAEAAEQVEEAIRNVELNPGDAEEAAKEIKDQAADAAAAANESVEAAEKAADVVTEL